MSKQILMLVGDYAEDYETMVPFQFLTGLGYTVHAVCPDKNEGESIATAIHDFEGEQTYSEKRGHNFAINYDFNAVNTQDYVVLSGGTSSEKKENSALFSDVLHMPHGLSGFFYYPEALAESKKTNKPIFMDFTHYFDNFVKLD